MVGKVLRAFFLIPVLAKRELAVMEVEEEEEEEEKILEHLRAHLMIEFNPREQIKAHNSTESTITTFESKLLLLLLLSPA